MTPTQFKEWRKAHDFSWDATALVLRKNVFTIATWEAGRGAIPIHVEHMCGSCDLLRAVHAEGNSLAFLRLLHTGTYRLLWDRMLKADGRRRRPDDPKHPKNVVSHV